MSVLTLRQLYEERNVHRLSCRVIIGGAPLPKWTSVSYQFSIGQAPTASIVVPNINVLPFACQEEASVEIWVGFYIGLSLLEKLVFAGGVVDSISNNGPEVEVECIMDGPRKLQYAYNRRIDFDLAAILATDAVTGLLDLAGVTNYNVELDPWVIGTAVPYTVALGNQLQFSTYGEAINKISEVDGSAWYALPTGQVRVENKPPVPADAARREYFTNQLAGIVSSIPAGASNPDAIPRINEISRHKFRSEVANFIEVDGAVLVTFGPNGEQNSEQIVEAVDGASGQFPNGAFWIPTPPLFQDFTFSDELIDTNAKAFEVAERYFNIKNRLLEKTTINVPADPDVFLCETVKVIDPDYTNVSSLYFVESYRTTIDGSGGVTELNLSGGPESGTIGFAKPFAEFIWKYQAIHNIVGGGPQNLSQQDLGPNSDNGAKLCEDLPAEIGNADQGADLPPGEDKPMVIINFDGSPSEDFDGFIVSYEWADDQGHGTVTGGVVTAAALTGPRVTFLYDPDIVSNINMTLTVTDDSGRKDSITKTVYTGADHINVDPPDKNPNLNDTPNGGGDAIGKCTPCGDSTENCGEKPGTPPAPGEPGSGQPGDSGAGGCNGRMTLYFLAAEAFAMGSEDNRTWNDLSKAAAGATGNFISVAVATDWKEMINYGIFGTDRGEIVISTNLCVTGAVVAILRGAVITLWVDREENHRVWAATDLGFLYSSLDNGQTWSMWDEGTGYPVYGIATPPGGSVWLFGGDTGDPRTLVRIDGKKTKDFLSLAFAGDILDAIRAAGPGFSISTMAINDTATLIGFNGGVSPAVWANSDPLGSPGGWIPAIGTPVSIVAAAPGFGGDFLVA